MKRPEGFDQRREPEPATRSHKAARKRSGARTPPVASDRQPALRPAAQPHPAKKTPRTTATRARGRSAVRAASRDRRRFERSEIRRFTRRTRHRRLGWGVAVGLLVTLGGVLAAAVYSPLLALRTITVDGAASVSAQEVTEAIDGQLGTPLALFDYGLLRSQLDQFPLIRSFVTEVVPPSTLIVHIVERSPVGAIATPAGFSIVDPAGVSLGSSVRRADGVPLIDIGGEGTDSVAFAAVVDVLLALPESIRSQVDVIRATSKDDVRLVLLGAGQRVVWGSAERSTLKARVLQELMAVQGAGARVEYDVSAPLSPVVRPG